MNDLFYIRGVKGRENEVIAALKKAYNLENVTIPSAMIDYRYAKIKMNKQVYYYIMDSKLGGANIGSDTAKLLEMNGEEIFLKYEPLTSFEEYLKLCLTWGDKNISNKRLKDMAKVLLDLAEKENLKNYPKWKKCSPNRCNATSSQRYHINIDFMTNKPISIYDEARNREITFEDLEKLRTEEAPHFKDLFYVKEREE